ncbi:MAG: MMPL family transporter, partial [Holophagales bacterium]|nr:MMPL family transporter [Holophagales bacterium]
LRRDLKLTISGSALGCTALLLAAFGGAGIPLAALAVLAVALVWTGALLGLGLGSVTAVSFGFAAVLVGLGLDYAIHGSTAYRRERFRGRPPAEALRATFHFAGPGITTSALTTSAAFATLGAAHFRPLRELGTVTAAGILTILLATATLGAALLTRLGHGKPGRLWSALAAAVASATRLGTRHPRAVLVATALLTAAALAGARQLHLDPDLRALRPAHHPVFEAEALLVDRFAVGLDTSTVVVRGEELDHALEAAGRIATSIRRTVPEVSVISPTDWIVPEPARRERLRALSPLGFGGAADLLEAELLTQGLAPRAFASGLEALRSLARGEDPGPPEPADWPSGLAELVRLGDPGTETGPAAGRGRAAAWVALRLRTPDGLWPEGPPTELRRLLEQQDPGVAIASVPRLGREMKALAVRDLESLAWIALSLVAMAVGVSFRGHLLSALLAMLPVLLGSLWALGLWGALGGRLDLLSLAVIPILLGIGIDDGLHAVHGARAGEGNLGEAVREAGLAMSLTTLTTCLGFGSLVLSSIPGLERGGLVVSLGVALCLAATLLVLPALGRLLPPLPTSAELARKIHETSS